MQRKLLFSQFIKRAEVFDRGFTCGFQEDAFGSGPHQHHVHTPVDEVSGVHVAGVVEEL
ncbi:hypothetical protein D3C76_1807570 [compost metagenome]